MNKVHYPVFIGPNSNLASRKWSQYFVAGQVLNGISEVSRRLMGRFSEYREPLVLLDDYFAETEEVLRNSRSMNQEDLLFRFLISIPGIGEKTADELVIEFGSISALAHTQFDELCTIKFIGEKRAFLIQESLDRLLN